MNIYKRFGASVINGPERNKGVSVFYQEWLPDHPILAVIASISLNILIAITGVLPSAFITAGTVGFLGLKTGMMILIVGEAFGAIISFILYRKGIKKLVENHKMYKVQNRLLRKLNKTDAISAFFIVILLRLLPFVPSGAVTLAAALSHMRLLSFSIAREKSPPYTLRPIPLIMSLN